MEEIRKQIEEMIKKYTNIKLEKLKEKILLTFYTGNTIYKKIEIKKEKENLEVHIPKDKRIIEVLQISEIERIILMLYKQSISKKHSKKEIEKIKKIYIPGQKLELINLYSSFNVLLPGTKGMIEFIDDLGNIHVIWEHKKNIQLVVGIDEFKIICPLCNQELNSKKEENIYERYRERLILQDTDILLLNIFETFIDTQFIDDTYAFFTMISKNNY